jgi:ABC-type bacteriocin/lantibiotic exporter with double-glycine peptidase domain
VVKTVKKHSVKRGALVAGCPFIFSFILLSLFSCALNPEIKESGSGRIIENVPFYPQEAYQCGPSSLSSVLHYQGVHITPENIAQDIYSKSARGTLDIDMVLYAEKKDLKARQYEGNFQDIKFNINSGNPLIVMVDYGFWVFQQHHFMVVIGYNEHGIIVHSGRERLKFIPLSDFLKSWKKTDFWTLLITSP